MKERCGKAVNVGHYLFVFNLPGVVLAFHWIGFKKHCNTMGKRVGPREALEHM